MLRIISAVAAITIFAGACGDAKKTSRSASSTTVQSSPVADSVRRDSIRRTSVKRVPTPEIVRGLYINRWAALGEKMGQLIEVAKTTEVNALVIDVKDDRGFVLYPSRVPLATEIGADTNRAM